MIGSQFYHQGKWCRDPHFSVLQTANFLACRARFFTPKVLAWGGICEHLRRCVGKRVAAGKFGKLNYSGFQAVVLGTSRFPRANA